MGLLIAFSMPPMMFALVLLLARIEQRHLTVATPTGASDTDPADHPRCTQQRTRADAADRGGRRLRSAA